MTDNLASRPSPDFRALFEAVPGLYLVLLPDAPDFTIAAVSNAYLQATMTEREAILGRGLFDVFPDNPDDPDATGVNNLNASLHSVLIEQEPHTMAVQKYDIRRPESEGGGFEERYWSPVNSPVLGADGEVACIIHRVEDVTERIRLEQQSLEERKRRLDFQARAEQSTEEARLLRESESLYRTLGEAVPNFIWACKPDGEATYVNQRWTEYTGLTLEQTGDIPQNVLHHPEDYPALVEIWRVAADRKEPYEAEFRYRRHDGVYRWFMARGIPIKDERGRILQWIGTNTDIHDRKVAEQALRESEERTRLIIETALDAVLTIDADGTITGWNAQAEAIFGWSREEALGRSLAETILPLPYREAHQRGLQRFLETGEGPVMNRRVEMPALHRYGHEFLVELAITSSRVQNTFTFSAFVRDISERKRQEEQRQALMSSARCLIWYSDVREKGERGLDWHLYPLDEAAAQRLLPLEIPPGKDHISVWTESHLPGERQRMDQIAIQKVREGQSYTQEFRCRNKYGDIQWLKEDVYVETIAVGQWRIVGVTTDITERMRLEEQLLQAQKLESVGRLAGGVAHDFNNLLTVILGYGEMMQDELTPNSLAREYLHNMLLAGDKASHLTGQLLAFARRQVIEPKVVQLNDLILSLDKMLRRLIGEHIELVMLPEEGLHLVRVDPGQFEQILVNLVINARDAMPDGGKITIETHNTTLDEDYCRHHEEVTPGVYAVLAVSDTGIGMDEAIRLHIFEPFFTTKEKGRGTGLGLATVYGIVKQAGGHIWLYSEPGEGTTFKIYLPRTTVAEEDHAESLPADSSGGSEVILVVEDEPVVRALAVQALRGQGYKVQEATNGEEALQLVKGHEKEIALLITDVIMPQMSGKVLADRLQAAHPALKILYASGYTENTIVHHGVLDSSVAFLSKPFTPTGLARKVREVLDSG